MIERARLDRHHSVFHHDAIVVGGGIAGLSVALGLAGRNVALLTRGSFGADGSSPLAQGGIAAPWGSGDSATLHAQDTLRAGAGLCRPEVVEALTVSALPAIRRLRATGAVFDHDAAGHLLLGREGAHSRARILHAGGDATGAEVVRALSAAVARQHGVQLLAGVEARELVLVDGDVVGLVARHGTGQVLHLGPVVLATGGLGQVYRYTTNPVEARGEGLAMAARAGAALADLEFVQFHPTALRAATDPLPLVTEALRGAGALLVDDRGERFMLEEHPDAELAPRDVVARAIWRRQVAGRRVGLDARDAVGDAFEGSFPSVFAACIEAGIDPRREPIPVTPAAHYSMGGIATGARGQTSLSGLWACGEAAATGAHGANRLASNSLLEGLVFGERVARDIAERVVQPPRITAAYVPREPSAEGQPGGGTLTQLRDQMWTHAGLVRSADSLQTVLRWIATHQPDAGQAVPAQWTVARLVAASAARREESRGAHFRQDFPHSSDVRGSRAFWTYAPDEELPLVPSSAPVEQTERAIA